MPKSLAIPHERIAEFERNATAIGAAQLKNQPELPEPYRHAIADRQSDLAIEVAGLKGDLPKIMDTALNGAHHDALVRTYKEFLPAQGAGQKAHDYAREYTRAVVNTVPNFAEAQLSAKGDRSVTG